MQCNQYLTKLLVMLFTITSSYSKIKINIKPASSRVFSVISYSGVEDKRVTENDIRMFNISENNLKLGVRVELGKTPDDIFIKDPTPYHNLYQKYEWTEVKRRIKVKRAQIFDIVNENITLAKHSVINSATGKLKKIVGLKEAVESTISSSWLEPGIPDDDILYNINVTYGNESFIVQNKWRKNNFHSLSLLTGLSNVGYILLNPGQAVHIELTAVKSILLLKVEYSALLVGSVIANYARVYGKYHFWAPSVGDIMKAIKLKNEIVTTEFIEIRSYVDPHIKVVDKYTLKPVHIIKPPIKFHTKKPKIIKTF